jgi:ZIP family zinc transporter
MKMTKMKAKKWLTRRLQRKNKKLAKMGINTVMVIGLHNSPEGLAMFVAALDDPIDGLILVFAIVIHNIPEGPCVALLIFYVTGNCRNAFLWMLVLSRKS